MRKKVKVSEFIEYRLGNPKLIMKRKDKTEKYNYNYKYDYIEEDTELKPFWEEMSQKVKIN